MSQAPDIETLMNPEGQVEGGFKALFAAQTVAMLPAFMTREVDKLPNERIDIQATMSGGHTGHRHKDNEGRLWLDAWNGQVTFQLCTSLLCKDPTGDQAKRSDPSDVADPHTRLRARIRMLAQYATESLSDEFFPHHTITKIQESGCTPAIQDDDIAVSEITFDCMVSIRSDAWPASGVNTFRFGDTTPVFGSSTLRFA